MSDSTSARPGAGRGRPGAALPLSILSLALMTAAMVAAFSATTAETVSNNAMRAQDRAYHLAETGLQQFVLRRGEPGFCTNCVTNPAVVDSEWTRLTLPGGYATVVATRVRPKLADGSPALFFLRSTGVDTTVRLGGAGFTVYATRTIGQYASFATQGIKTIAAWTSFNGITNNAAGVQIPINGTDECGQSAHVAGAVVPAGGQYRGTGPNPFSMLGIGVDSTMSIDSLKKRVGIDWNAIVKYDVIPADFTIPPSGSWPAAWRFADTAFWPIIRVKSNFTVPGDGRGLIIADSNLSFTSNNVWDGIVLVGGTLVSSGNDTTSGVVISGLNRTLPGAVNPPNGTSIDNDLLSNTKRFRYNSCRAKRAAERLQMYFVWSNTWSDNVAIW
jgi:hypothetical protein